MIDRLVLSKREFDLFKTYVYDHIGISLGDQKIYLVQARLAKRVKQLGLNDFGAYYNALVNDRSGAELEHLSSLISTNVTAFFREKKQWEFLKTHLESILATKRGKLRIWSAACSSGEEPYSLAMFFDEHAPSLDVKILATDVSARVLKEAIRGVYSEKACATLESKYLNRYFTKEKRESQTVYHISEALKKKIVFRGFNLVTGNYALFREGHFDIIFCRNVMIYFDKPTQNTLVEKFYHLLCKEGYLFIGSSEALTDIKSAFKSKSASIYQKV